MSSIKTVNKLIIFMTILFALSGLFTVLDTINQRLEFQARSASLMEQVESYNFENRDFFKTANNSEPLPHDEEMGSACESLITAFENFENANSYYSEAEGYIRGSVFGYSLYVDLFFKRALYPNGDFYQEVFASERGDRFGGRVGAMLMYYSYEEDKVYYNFTWDTEKISTTEYRPNYSESSWTVKTIQDITGSSSTSLNIPLYDVTKGNIINEHYFSTKRNNKNQVEEYYSQVSLSAIDSTNRYRRLSENIVSAIRPDAIRGINFQEVTMSAVIGSDGNLNTVNVNDKFQARAYVYFLGINLNINAESNVNYLYSSINSDIDIERPEIPESVKNNK